MKMNIMSSDFKSVLIVVLVSLVPGRTNACLECGWEFLTEDLFPSLCPILSGTSSFLKDLFSLDSNDEECALEIHVIPPDLIKESFKRGRELSKSALDRGNKLVKGGASLDAYSPSISLFFNTPLSGDLKKASRTSQEMIAATKVLQMKMCSSSDITTNTFMSFLENQVIKGNSDTSCKPFSIKCKKDKYRSIDGTCNNLQRPGWGRRGAQYTRIAEPRYADGIHSMPVAKSGGPLPNPRVISMRLFPNEVYPSHHNNFLNMQFGQFLIHDLTLRAMEVTDEGGIQCCVGEGTDVLSPDWQNDNCIPIRVPDDDPFYSQYGIRCLNLVRSVTVPRDDCKLGYAEQMNGATSYLDGSQIYSPDKKTSLNLRTKKKGRLREVYKTKEKKGYLPTADDKSASCDLRNASDPCYVAGDPRVNQTPILAMVQTLFLREHNRVADTLSGMNPSWDDDRIFNEARRIVIAELQHITYQEWLPHNFGESYFRYYRISPTSLFTQDYSASVNPAIINSASAAALRGLHSQVPEDIMTCPGKFPAAFLHKLSDSYNNPVLLERSSEAFDEAVRGALMESSAAEGPRCTLQMAGKLFRSRQAWGLDLVAIDVQRGRDHGIASYNDFREICGLRRARTFQDLSGEIPQEHINTLSQIYEDVEDIDLYVGGSLERQLPGSVLGHTFQCIVAEQFYRIRVGDRFFYDNGGMPHSFCTEQLKQLKQTSMARLICDNTGVRYVQKRAFERESPANPKIHCDDYSALPRVDFSAWKK